MGILKGIFKARDKPKDAISGSRYSFFFGGTTAGKQVNEHTALQMTAVYSCVRILEETVGRQWGRVLNDTFSNISPKTTF